MIKWCSWILAIALCICFCWPSECTTQAPGLLTFLTSPVPFPSKASPRPSFKFKYSGSGKDTSPSVVDMINPPNLYRRLKIPYKWYSKDNEIQPASYGKLQHFDTPIFAGFPENPPKDKWPSGLKWGEHKFEKTLFKYRF